jgi:polar amino acid transport system substrate-binding protein
MALLLFPFSAQAEEKILKVGVALGEPFAQVVNKEYYGIAVDIWKQLAEELNLKYQFVALDEHIDEDVDKLATGQIDVLIGPIVPTYERMKRVDFLQPFYLNQIGLVVPAKGLSFLNALGSIFNEVTKAALLILLVFTLIYFHVYWYYELRKQNKTYKNYGRGILETCWLHTLDIDMSELPTHILTRLFRFLWLVLITLFFSSITASITSSLTIALSGQYASYASIDEYKDKQVVAVMHTAPYDIAKSAGFTHILPVNNRDEAISLLLNGQAAAYIDYSPVAEHYLVEHKLTHELMMTSLIIQRDTFVFALPINSPLRHSLDLKLRSRQEEGIIKLICEKHFGDSAKSSVNCEL